MALVPYAIDGKILFYDGHNTPWSTNATAIGTTAAAVADLQAKTAATRAALIAQTAAQSAAKNATATLKAAVEAMDLAGQAIISNIRSKAKTSGDGVYRLASIPAPATPTAAGAPGTPTDFKTKLNPDGSLDTSWKCSNPPGGSVIYQIYRKTGASGDFVLVGGSGERKLTDVTIPAGVAQVTYSIQAIRTTAAGQAAQFVVNFGAGGVTAQRVEAMKLAA